MIVHILWYEDLKFLPLIIGTVNDDPDIFDRENQLFVVASETMYAVCPKAENVVLDTEFSGGHVCSGLINKYAPKATGIILHVLPEPMELFRVKRRHLGKILWKMWGYDTVFPYRQYGERKFRDFLKRRVKDIWLRRIKSFRAVCGDSLSDFIVLRELVGDAVPILKYSYGNPKMDALPITDDSCIEDCGLDIDPDALNIMLGHSGFPEESHIEMLKKLEAYRDQNIRIYIVLAYGDAEYMPEVEAYAKERWPDAAYLLTEPLPFAKYQGFLRSMDVAILDGTLSYALGNIIFLIRHKKKFVVNPDGIIRKAFDLDHIPYLTSDTAFDMPFEEFAAPFAYPEDAGRQMCYDKDEIVKGLHEVFGMAAGSLPACDCTNWGGFDA